VWAKFTGGTAQTDLKGIGVNGDPGLLDAVIKDPLGIGYNNLGYAFDLTTGKSPAGAVVVPIDANKNGLADPDELIADKDTAAAVVSGKYPTPPARTEFLVTKGEPSGVVRDFIRWILADGQKLLAPAGYVALQGDQLAAEQAKVK
jgi:phosphate transport system substrate-binding protein